MNLLEKLRDKWERYQHKHHFRHYPDGKIRLNAGRSSEYSHCKFCGKRILELNDGTWFDPKHPNKGLVVPKIERGERHDGP